MYHCHLHFYCAGRHPEAFDKIRELPPLDGFMHTFAGGAGIDAGQAAGADVVLADVREMGPEAAD